MHKFLILCIIIFGLDVIRDAIKYRPISGKTGVETTVSLLFFVIVIGVDIWFVVWAAFLLSGHWQ